VSSALQKCNSYIYKPDTRSTKNSETEKKKEWRREKNGKEEEVPLVPREYQPRFSSLGTAPVLLFKLFISSSNLHSPL
jgi:hypothetical protein